MAADALSTALTVLGPVDGPAWAEERGIAALFVTRRPDGHLEERLSSAFAALA
jgi:thiamine biosynthesis lipoprotein